MQNARLDKSQAGIKMARRNTNNLRYENDTTLMAERGTKEPLDEGEGEGPKSCLKTQHPKSKIMAFSPITSWQIDGGRVEAVIIFFFLGLQNLCGR